MRYLKLMMAMIFLAMPILIASQASADQDNDSHYWYRNDNAPDINIWTNKGYDANYYFGEDVAVYFQTDRDCYAVVYDVDPSGDVRVLYPSSIQGSTFVRGGDVYRVPGNNDEFRLEVADVSGMDRIYAVASYDYINPPDFMRYVGYDYGDPGNYDDNQFVLRAHGDIDNFIADIDYRITDADYSVAYTRFNVDEQYRNYRYYRYADYPAYDVGSVWIGCDFPGSEIWIDGIYYGISPVLVPRIFVGYHWVWVYYGGYPCYQQYFWVPRYHRYDLNIRVDQHFRDGRYRHDRFHRWAFDQRPVRNNSDFVKEARQLREKSIRTRSLPSGVVRDYVDRGVIRRDSPLAKGIRTDRTIDRTPTTPVIRPDRGKVERDVVNERDKNVVIEQRGKSKIIERRDDNSQGKGEVKRNTSSEGRGKGEVKRNTGSDSPNKGDVKRDSGSENRGREARPNKERIEREKRINNSDDRSGMIITPLAPRAQAPDRQPSEVTSPIRRQEQARAAESRRNEERSSSITRNVERQISRQDEQKQQTEQKKENSDNGNYKRGDNSNSSQGRAAEKAPRNDNSSRGRQGGRAGRGK